MKKLHELTEKEFNILKEGGMLVDFYPDAPTEYKNISGKRPIPREAFEINVQVLIDLTESYFDDIERDGYSKDFEHWC